MVPAESRRSRFRVGPNVDAVAVALLAFVVSFVGIGNPSFWYDEAATISASTRSISELIDLVSSTDSAHTFYYVLMHGWFAVFPESEAWSRLPSAVAIAVAGAGVVVLGKLLSRRAVGVTAGIVFAILPRVTLAGIEARPYALAIVVSTWLTIVLFVATRRGATSWWLLYAVLVVLSVLVNIHLLLLVPVHLIALIMLGNNRSQLRAWGLSTVLAVVLLSPYLAFMRAKSTQLSWIDPLDERVFGNVLLTQYFDFSIAFAVVAFLLLGTAVVLFFARRERVATSGMRAVAVLSIVWIVVPTVGLLLYSLISQPIYVDRYLSFTAPAMALLIGACVVAIAQKPAPIAAVLVVMAIAATPNWIDQRGDYAKFKMDYSQVADLIGAQASSGDCLLLDDTVSWEPGPIRPLLAARPEAYRGLIDVGLWQRARPEGLLWDTNAAPHLRRDQIRACTVIWIISEKDKSLSAHDEGPALDPGPRLGPTIAYRVPARMGFHVVERWQFNISQVTKSVR
ncbi:glycosyltransferase family 39 protein [Williamsia sp. D3]|uniref:glycosyltransferase family 39 protein n=1 Tax=Williamsia sp. D3 TaxID=1313067 RepID=UPI0003D39EE6|nr:glycosyltransferase family 39 protein [Williamsia sp. D3]ETD30199.1 membrane protein [Williamsia sp. D3]